jgi:hypothetical protein
VTRDRAQSAQFEHTVGVTETGGEIFTLSPTGADRAPDPMTAKGGDAEPYRGRGEWRRTQLREAGAPALAPGRPESPADPADPEGGEDGGLPRASQRSSFRWARGACLNRPNRGRACSLPVTPLIRENYLPDKPNYLPVRSCSARDGALRSTI